MLIMAEEKARFDVNAKVVGIIHGNHKKVKMSDGTFRAYYPFYLKGEAGVEHFSVGEIGEKTDDEILLEMSELLCGSGVQFYHEDGTPHV